MALSDDILKLKELAKGGNPLQAGMEQAGGTLQLPQAPAAQPPQGEGSLPVPPSIPTVNQGGVDVPISGDQLQKWQEWMRVKGGQGEASAPLSPAAPAPSSPVDPSSKIPQDMQSRIAELNEVFARPNLVQNGSLASPSPAPTGAEFDFSGLPNISETGLSEEALGRLSPTAQGSITDVPTATEDRMTPTFQGMGAGGGQIAPEGMAPTIGPDGRAVFADRGTAQDLAEAELATQREDRAAQQRFLASPEAKEFSSRQLRSAIMGDGQFGRESVAREQRAAESFGQPRGPDSRDRDRRGTMSMADATQLTGGDRDAARALLKRQELGLGEFAPEKAEQTGLTPYQAISAAQKQQEIDLKIQSGVDTKEAKAQVDRESSLTNVRATQDAFNKLEPVAREIATLSGGAFTEGAFGWAASKLPMATDAKQIDRLAKELEGTTFLQGLIEAKAKGATFGALSEREGDRILAARGKLLDPSSTNEQRIKAVNDMMSTIQTSAERAKADHESKYGTTTAETTQETGGTPLKAGQVATSSGKTYTIK